MSIRLAISVVAAISGGCISIPDRIPLEGDGGAGSDASTDGPIPGRKRTIAITPVMPISTNLGPTPVAIRLDGDADYIANGRVDGSDLLFYANETVLPHEIESIDQPAGDLLVWVRLPSFAAAGETLEFFYGGTPRTTNEPLEVFADWALVWHFGDYETQPGEAKDSAADNAGSTGSALSAVPGSFGNGIELTGSALASQPNAPIYPGTSPFTISCWVTTTAQTSGSVALRLGVLDTPDFGVDFLFDTGAGWGFRSTIAMRLVGADDLPIFVSGQRAQLSVHVDSESGTITPRVNGEGVFFHNYAESFGDIVGSQPLVLGENMSGVFDEVRLVRRNRSLDELSIERQNALTEGFMVVQPATDANYP